MAQLNLVPTLPQFDAYSEPSSIATRWKEWLEQFEIFTVAANITDKKQKRALLLHLGGPSVQNVFKGLADTGDDYDTAAEKLNEYFAPKKNIRYERYKFKQACQQDGESIDQFASRLRYLAETCDFESVDDVIADQILANCNSLRLKERILREEKADLTFILKQARILECSKQQASHISGKSKSAEINAIRGGWKPGIRNSGIRQQQESKRESGAKCRNCGQTWPHDQSKPCPALGKTCFACGKQNHFFSVSASKTPRGIPRTPEQNPKREHLHQVDQYDSSDELSEENEEYVYSTTTIKVQNPTLPDESVSVISQPRLQVRIGGTPVTVMMDSGPSVNILAKMITKESGKRTLRFSCRRHPPTYMLMVQQRRYPYLVKLTRLSNCPQRRSPPPFT
jgi:hypothetical protein